MKKHIHLVLLLVILFQASSCASEKNESASKVSTFEGRVVFQRDDFNLTRQEILSGKEFRGDMYTAVVDLKSGSQKKINLTGFCSWSDNGSKLFISSRGDKKIYVLNQNLDIIQEIGVQHKPGSFSTFDGNQIYYVQCKKINRPIEDFYQIMKYDAPTAAHTEIKSFGQDEEISDLHISPDGKKLVYSSSSTINYNIPFELFVFDIESGIHQKIYMKSIILGWDLDNNSIYLKTNTSPDGTWMNTPFGVLAKVNIHTKEFTILRKLTGDIYGSRLSPDKKWIVYNKSVKPGGQAIFIQSVATGEEIQITTPRKLPNGKYSEDSFPDWYQGEHPLID